MHPSSAFEAEQLQARLHRIARRLVQDESTADDLVQETWLAALGSNEEHVRDRSAWLGGVVRRMALGLHRRRGRRRRAERQAARSEMFTDDGMRERIDTYRWLERTVDSLPDPYGGVLRMRFFEELSHRAIAEELDRPLETVHSQIRRGLAKMRERMDREHGGERSAWALLLVRTGARPSAGSTVVLGSRGLLWVAALLVLGLGIWGVLGTLGRGSADGIVAGVEAPGSLRPMGFEEASEPEGGNRGAVEGGASPPLDPGGGSTGPVGTAAAKASDTRIVFDVLNGDGIPAPDARLMVFGGTDAILGSFPADERGRVEARLDPSWATPVGQGVEGVVIAAKSAHEAWSANHFTPIVAGETIRGTLRLGGPIHRLVVNVQDPMGEPVSGATLVAVPRPLRIEQEPDGRVVTNRRLVEITDREGRATLASLGSGTFELRVEAKGFQRWIDVLECTAPEAHRTFVLHPGARAHGRVLDASGSPAEGAEVRVYRAGLQAPLRTTSDALGRWEIEGVPFGHRVISGSIELGVGDTRTVHFERDVPVPSIDLDCRELESISLRLRREDGIPRAPSDYAALFAKVDGVTWFDRSFLDEEGRAEFFHFPEAPLTLMLFTQDASAAGRTAAEFQGVRPRDEDYEVVLRPTETATSGGRVSGSLRDASGQPFEHAWVEFWGQGLQQLYSAPIDPSDGAFELDDVRAGVYRAIAVCGAWGVVDFGELELTAGGAHDLGSHRAPNRRAVELEDGVDRAQFGHLEALFPDIDPTRIGPGRSLEGLELLPGNYRFVPADGGEPIRILVPR